MNFLITLVILGLIFYLVDRFIPMIEPFKTIFRIVVAIIAVVLLLQFLGVNLGIPTLSLR